MQPDFYDRPREPHIGVLATLRRSGLPYTVPVWWLWHDDAPTTAPTDAPGASNRPTPDVPCVSRHWRFGRPYRRRRTATAVEIPDFDIWPITRMLVDKYVG